MAGNPAYPYTEANKPLGAPRAAAYYHDANEANNNFQAVGDLAGVRFVRGINCVDKASNPAQCEIWLETHPGAGTGSREVSDVNAWVLIVSGNDGAGNPLYIWEVQAQVVGADVFVVFSDAIGLEKGVAPTGLVYNNAGFIDGLGVFICPTTTRMQWIKDNILFSNVDAGGVTASDIPRAVGASNVEADLATVETDFAVEHGAPGAGQHNAEIVTNNVLNVDAFAPGAYSYEGFENLIDGDFEYDDDGDGVVNGWEPYLAPPTVQLTNIPVKRGIVSQQVTTLGAGPGIHAYADYRLHLLATDFQNMIVSFAALIHATANDSVVLEINDGVGVTTRAAGGVAGSWVWLHVSRTMDAAATTCEVRIYANQATTFYVDGAICHYGRLNIGYINSPGTIVDTLMGHSDGANWLPNGDCKDWTNLWGGVAGAVMDHWTVTLGAPAIAQNAVTYLYGRYSLDVTAILGDAIQTGVLNFNDFVNPYDDLLMVSFYYYNVAGPATWTVTIDDGAGAPVNVNITPTAGWQRFIYPHIMSPAAAFLTLTLTCVAGGQTIFDGFMINKGWVRQAFKPSAVLNPTKWDFVMAGAIVPTNMTFHGSLLEAIVPSDMILHRIMVYSTVAPGGAAVDTYDVMVNGVAAGITATVTGASNVGATHVPGGIAINQGDRIQVAVGPGLATAGADVSAVVEGIRIGN